MNELFERYQVEKPLGKGGYGEVIQAFDLKMERLVAIKRIPRSGVTSLRAHREATTLALLNHPNIVKVYDFQEDEHFHYLIMEVLEGLTLAEIIAGASPDINEAMAIASQLCNALEYAHGNDILHRDIKPTNIMVLPEGQIKILDFGTAKLKDSVTTDSGFTGTISYIAPEQAHGDQATEESDQYSLALVLYQLLTGTHPFDAETPAGIIFKILNNSPADPCLLNRKIPQRLAGAILKALSKEDDERFSSITEFRYKLDRFMPADNEKAISGLYRRATRSGEPASMPVIKKGKRRLPAKIGNLDRITAPLLVVLFGISLTGRFFPLQAGVAFWAAAGAVTIFVPWLAAPLWAGTILLFVALHYWWVALILSPFLWFYLWYWRNHPPYLSLLPFAAPLLANAGIPTLTPFLFHRLKNGQALLGGMLSGWILLFYDLLLYSRIRPSKIAVFPDLLLKDLEIGRFLADFSSPLATHPIVLIQPVLWGLGALGFSFASSLGSRKKVMAGWFATYLAMYLAYFLLWQDLINWRLALQGFAVAIPLFIILSFIGKQENKQEIKGAVNGNPQ